MIPEHPLLRVSCDELHAPQDRRRSGSRWLCAAAAALGLITTGSLAQDKDWKAAYREAFYKNARRTVERLLAETPEMKGSSPAAIAEAADPYARGVTECHMVALAAYSPKLQEAAFKAIQDGGSYADAKMAFDTAFAAEGVAGGERGVAIKEMFEAAMKAGNECMKNVKEPV